MTPEEIKTKIADISERLQIETGKATETAEAIDGINTSLKALILALNDTAPYDPVQPYLGLFWYTPDYPPRVADYGTFVLQDSATINDRIASGFRLAENYMYVTPVARRSADPNGYTQCTLPSRVPNSWLYSSGTRVFGGATEQFINPGNDSYISEVTSSLPPRLSSKGFDGVMVDEVNEDPRWTYPNTTVPKATHQADMLKFLRALKKSLPVKQVIVNLGANYGSQFSNDVMAAVDGVWLEQYIGRSLSGMAPAFWGTAWDTTQKWLFKQNNKEVIVNVASSDQKVIDYAYCSFLLVVKDGDTFCSQPGGNGTPAYVSPNLIDASRKLGAPVGDPVFSSLVSSRPFEYGTVNVYPTSAYYASSGVVLNG